MNGALAIASAPRHDARAIQKIEDPDLKPHAGFRLPACLHKNKMRPCGPVRTLHEEGGEILRGVQAPFLDFSRARFRKSGFFASLQNDTKTSSVG